MKKCAYCGREYPDEATECVIDHQPLAPLAPEPRPNGSGSGEKAQNVVVRTFSSREAAQLAASNLQAHGIECRIHADDCGGMYPNLTAPGGVRLLVHPSDAAAAIGLLNTQASPSEINQLEIAAATSVLPETAPPRALALGQMLFGLAVGVIFGIFLCLFYQWANHLGLKTYYHYHHGKPDEAWVYRNGYLVEFMQDRNFDGNWDHWTYYQHGYVTRSEYDNNFDGQPDLTWAYSNGVLMSMKKDTDFNGQADEFCTYKDDLIQQVDYRPNGSKFSTTRELFRNDVLIEIDRGGDSNGNFKSLVRYDPFFNPIGTKPINTDSPMSLPLPASNSK